MLEKWNGYPTTYSTRRKLLALTDSLGDGAVWIRHAPHSEATMHA